MTLLGADTDIRRGEFRTLEFGDCSVLVHASEILTGPGFLRYTYDPSTGVVTREELSLEEGADLGISFHRVGATGWTNAACTTYVTQEDNGGHPINELSVGKFFKYDGSSIQQHPNTGHAPVYGWLSGDWETASGWGLSNNPPPTVTSNVEKYGPDPDDYVSITGKIGFIRSGQYDAITLHGYCRGIKSGFGSGLGWETGDLCFGCRLTVVYGLIEPIG